MKKNTFVLILSLAVVLILLNSCRKKETTSASYTPTCNGATPSFSTSVKPLFQSSCVGCHSNYSTFSQISGSASSIRTTIVNGSMPKGTSLSEEQKNNIVCWIDGGKPNN